MNVEIEFPNYDSQRRAFITWRPVEVKLRLIAAPVPPATVHVTVSAKTTSSGAKLSFATMMTHLGSPSIDLALPQDGSDVSVWVGGEFPAASQKYGDVEVIVKERSTGQLLGSHPTMVRIRKNANNLSNAERDRFLAALATLNGAGTGRFSDFRDMHVGGAPDREAHGGPGFLPWHRSYLLDLERELQMIDAEVALPYWRFDQAAPNVFNRSFMGVSNTLNQVQFAAGHPLLGWVGSGPPGIDRGPGVGATTIPSVFTEAQTLQLGGAPVSGFRNFRSMQGNPHGGAHMSHGSGWITSISTAPRDPIFFLLHCNVDRLWAKWQWAQKRHDPNDPNSFTPAGFSPGHNLSDAMWPWCGPLTAPRPTTAPGGGLAPSPMTAAPGVSPKVSDMIDYLGTVTATHLAFAYDDVPFQI